jgi:hypothetical protein
VSWLTRLRAEEAGHDLTGREVDELIGPLVFNSDVYGHLLFPVGFRTNYCSVPRWPIAYWMVGGKARKPSAGHDFPYTTHCLLQVEFDAESGAYTPPKRLPIDRRQADDLFLEMLLKEPLVGEGLALTMHKAVRWFGQSSWEDDTNILQRPEIMRLAYAHQAP